MTENIYCNNCGKKGHMIAKCKYPIISHGIIAYRYNKKNEIEFLMICRKDSLGFVDFVCGKYMVENKQYILNLLKQMTIEEKELLKTNVFDDIWRRIWGDYEINKYKMEYFSSKEKFYNLKNGVFDGQKKYDMDSLLKETENICWNEPEWGFPKGRKNQRERDYDCAIREFCEETGYESNVLKNIKNIYPFEETFLGSNYKCYKHKYYLMYMNYEDTVKNNKYDVSEVGNMEWKNYDNCMSSIRPYNLEKKKVITNVYNLISKYNIC